MFVLKRLRSAGFEALFAGGSVRDMLLGRKSYDYDVATNATPKQVKRLFRHVLLVGAQFGVAMVIHNGRRVEVTTFRSDESYSDGRRPDSIRYADARQDALRRDFTINGMFYDPLSDEVIDYVGGREDLKRGVIRTIGSPDDRFAEDYLRMVRAVRFAVRLDFRMDPATAEGIRKYAGNVRSVSGERIFEELWRMFSEPSAAEALRKMDELGLAEHVVGELFEADVWPRAVERVEYVAARRDPVLTLAAALVDLPPRDINAVTRRWGASNDLRNAIRWMHEHLGDWRRAEQMPLRELKRLMASEHFERLRRLWRFQEKRETGREAASRHIAGRVKSIPADAVAPPPLVSGADLKELGVEPGPRLGRILRETYDAQLDERVTSRGEAMAMARKLVEATGRRQ
ncbi:MAG: CCA tRNA nucleotidyltransferase [Phycisphaerae bacterium]